MLPGGLDIASLEVNQNRASGAVIQHADRAKIAQAIVGLKSIPRLDAAIRDDDIGFAQVREVAIDGHVGRTPLRETRIPRSRVLARTPGCSNERAAGPLLPPSVELGRIDQHIQRLFLDVDPNLVTVTNQPDRPTVGGFRRDMTHARPVVPPLETTIGKQQHVLLRPA